MFTITGGPIEGTRAAALDLHRAGYSYRGSAADLEVSNELVRKAVKRLNDIGSHARVSGSGRKPTTANTPRLRSNVKQTLKHNPRRSSVSVQGPHLATMQRAMEQLGMAWRKMTPIQEEKRVNRCKKMLNDIKSH